MISSWFFEKFVVHPIPNSIYTHPQRPLCLLIATLIFFSSFIEKYCYSDFLVQRFLSPKDVPLPEISDLGGF